MNQNQSTITQEELNTCIEIINKINEYYAKRIVGQQNLEKSLLIALMANGHILLESVPGLAKTTAAKVLTEAVAGRFSRVQCTPDLLPSDIIGTQVFNYKTSQFDTKIGPIYANFVLLDEINRSSAKTQSATLEAMQEKQITIDGKIYKLPDIFTVIATQNPIEQEGTYILAEAQLDRFLIKAKVDYPTVKEEVEILNNIENKIFYEFRKAMNTFDYHVVMESFTQMAARNIDMTKECNVSACCSRMESCDFDFSYNPTGVSLDKYGCFMKFAEEESYAEF